MPATPPGAGFAGSLGRSPVPEPVAVASVLGFGAADSSAPAGFLLPLQGVVRCRAAFAETRREWRARCNPPDVPQSVTLAQPMAPR